MLTFQTLETRLTQFSAGFAILGGLGLIFATLITCISIILKLLGRAADTLLSPEALPWLSSILGEEELVQYGVGLALYAALPWVMIQKGHIKIDLFKPYFAGRLNRLLDLLGDILLTGLAYLIMTRQWGLIFKSPRGDDLTIFQLLLAGDIAEITDRLRDSQISQIIGIPLWPTYIVAEVCVIVFFLIGLFCILRSGRDLLRGTVPDA